jgi:hypothetical protein
VPLFRSKADFSDLRREAARLQQIESLHVQALRAQETRARVRIWTLAEFLENPIEHLQDIVDDISPGAMRRLSEAPVLADLSGFGRFIQNLRNQGMQPTMVGDIPLDDMPPPAPGRRGRPYLVK